MDGRTDRQTDGGDYNIPFAFLKKRGDNYIDPLYSDGFSHTDKSNKDGISKYIF